MPKVFSSDLSKSVIANEKRLKMILKRCGDNVSWLEKHVSSDWRPFKTAQYIYFTVIYLNPQIVHIYK